MGASRGNCRTAPREVAEEGLTDPAIAVETMIYGTASGAGHGPVCATIMYDMPFLATFS